MMPSERAFSLPEVETIGRLSAREPNRTLDGVSGGISGKNRSPSSTVRPKAVLTLPIVVN